MKKLTVLLIFSTLLSSISYGQGTNNEFDLDNEDINFVFSKLGFDVFKFPVRQPKNTIYDIVVEEYRVGKLTKRTTAIEMTQEAFKGFGIDAKNYAVPPMDSTQLDSTYFHRFYFEQGDSLLTLHIKTHGITAQVDFDISDLTVGNVRARYDTRAEINNFGHIEVGDEKELLLFFYANNNPEKSLQCPASLPVDMIKKNFYYAVFVYISPIE